MSGAQAPGAAAAVALGGPPPPKALLQAGGPGGSTFIPRPFCWPCGSFDKVGNSSIEYQK